VVSLEILQRPALLAAPTVAIQDFLAECCIHFRIESEPRASLPSKNRRILHSLTENFRFALDTVANCESIMIGQRSGSTVVCSQSAHFRSCELWVSLSDHAPRGLVVHPGCTNEMVPTLELLRHPNRVR
jgi:hypothetical protein